jgi:hypothetical protein
MKTAALLMLLATAFPAEPVPFVDAPVVASVPAGATFDVSTLPHWLQTVLAVLGAIVPVASLLASILNRYVRAATERGEKVPTWMLALAVPVNAASLNVDKAAQQVGMMKKDAP